MVDVKGKLDELQKALNSRPYLENYPTVQSFENHLDLWHNDLKRVFSAFQKGFEKCKYVDAKGEPAFLCTTCSEYHGFRRGCEWKVSGVEEK